LFPFLKYILRIWEWGLANSFFGHIIQILLRVLIFRIYIPNCESKTIFENFYSLKSNSYIFKEQLCMSNMNFYICYCMTRHRFTLYISASFLHLLLTKETMKIYFRSMNINCNTFLNSRFLKEFGKSKITLQNRKLWIDFENICVLGLLRRFLFAYKLFYVSIQVNLRILCGTRTHFDPCTFSLCHPVLKFTFYPPPPPPGQPRNSIPIPPPSQSSALRNARRSYFP
jgi:hypothetical protein